MSNHRVRFAGLVLASVVLAAAGAARAETILVNNVTVHDKPNDNGTGIIVTWERLPDEGADLNYEVLIADPDEKADLVRRLDRLVELKAITAERKAEILDELKPFEQDGKLFWSQGKWSTNRRKGARLALPLCPLKSDMPGSFGFASDHEETPDGTCSCDRCQFNAVEFNKWAHRDLAIELFPLAHGELVRALKEEALVSKITELKKKDRDKDPLRITVRLEIANDSIGKQPQRFEKREREFKRFDFQVKAWREGAAAPLATSAAAGNISSSDWFARQKINVLIGMIVLSVLIMASASYAKRYAHKLFIRRIGGLEAVDDALGRAAEMGKPVFFCYGPGGIGSVVNISSINILGKVAERVAEYGTELKVTCMDYMVMQVSQEVVRDGYMRAGRPDAYRDDNIFFVSGNTFAYSAAVSAQMIRENAGTAFYFGHFGSESLLLSETGAVTKAIQIAGTDSFNQIPFFITTCDYTLIAEEMYAASAYLSREPRLVGAVKGQDAVKALFMTLIFLGAGLASFGLWWFARLFWPLT